ncbi:MAG: metallophosphoesterase family protein, partial [Anaerolineaceae bacterium]|nr:metallophosphoesterase family protein [Anaerolineaceae bacterium]
MQKDLNKDVVRIGVLSDTHIPDRVGALHPDILPAFKEMGVELIIHAGDISSPVVLRQLET